MLQTIESKLQQLSKLEPTIENEFKIRSLIAEISAMTNNNIHDEHDKNALSACLLSLRKLENNKCACAKKCDYSFFDIAKLLENICLCSDILLADTGVNLHFESEKAEISCCPQIIIDAFLNLISNSVKFGRGTEIDATLTRNSSRITVIVSNDGEFDFSSASLKSGIRTAHNAARLHHGRLFYSSCDKKVRAGFSIPCTLEPTIKFDIPPFSFYLEDTFSPVHIGLAGLI
ncbi:MAG: hypothetical protein NC122_03980 [Faecalibacterium sp.]|nr:hypothetical protein [Ruminococcus sp.]MCM1391742.1 hypothetical protein [Ruminococcus sp.]MCM1485345.1 hypothetical protein [Faecalibacterium sp.]